MEPAEPTFKVLKNRRNSLQNVAALKVLLNAIAIRPRTQPEIIELSGLCNSTVSRWLRFLHASTKETKNLVYIADWRRTGRGGNPSACWALGYGMADVPKPKPLTQAEYSRRSKQKKLLAATKQIVQTDKGIKHVIE